MKGKDNRIPALIRFASAITVLNLFGHFYLGFEQSVAHWVVALLTAYSLELGFEYLSAKLNNKKPAFLEGGFKEFIYFLLPGHITGSAVSMLLFTNERIAPIIFAVAVGLLSKVIFKVQMNGKLRHFLNPSNTGIGVMLVMFPWVGVAPPYQFSEITSGWSDWLLVGIFLTLGSFLNAVFTKKIPLIAAWVGGFFLQAVIRTAIMGTSTVGALMPMTGIAFILFTFYMVSDPATTPNKTKNQVMFGLSVAAVYGLMMSFHIVFALFIALMIVCTGRGLYFWILDTFPKASVTPIMVQETYNSKVTFNESLNGNHLKEPSYSKMVSSELN
jgi:enediyne biosynthesis protein E5